MKKAILLAFLIVGSSSGCISSRPDSCVANRSEALKAVSSLDWSMTGIDDLLAQPIIDWASTEHVQSPSTTACSGITMIRDLQAVVNGECACCLTFEFGRVAMEGTCRERLEGIVIETVQQTRTAASATVDIVYEQLSVPGAARAHSTASDLFDGGVQYTWQSGASIHTIDAIAREIKGDGYRLRITHRRFAP